MKRKVILTPLLIGDDIVINLYSDSNSRANSKSSYY
jgi:hypothetical protein